MALHDIYASIDLGSESIKIVIADQTEKGLEIRNFGEYTSHGISRGEVIDVDLCYTKLNELVKQFSTIEGVIVNFSSISIIGKNYKSDPTKMRGKITKDKINFNIESAEHYHNLKQQNKKIFTYPFQFKINHTKLKRRPIGVKADYLQVDYHLVHLNQDVVNNIYAVIERTHIDTAPGVISAIASSSLVLTNEQKRRGVCLLDIGAEVCDLIVFKEDIMQCNAVLEFGGIDIDNAISYVYDCSQIEAQRLKEQHGFISANNINATDEYLVDFEQQDGGQKTLSNYQLAEIIEDSYYQLLKQVKSLLKINKLSDKLMAGFVIIGGGAQMKGCVDLMRVTFKNKVLLPKVNRHYLSKNNIVFKEDRRNDKVKTKSKIKNKSHHQYSDYKKADYKYYNALALLCYQPNEDYLKEAVKPKLEKEGVTRRLFGLLKKLS